MWQKEANARCRQFDGQWQPIESQTDLSDGRSIVLSSRENQR